MFIAILSYKKPLSEVDKYLAAHREYLAKHYALGHFIASGPQTPRVGGVIMMKSDSRETVDAMAFYPMQLQRYDIVHYRVLYHQSGIFHNTWGQLWQKHKADVEDCDVYKLLSEKNLKFINGEFIRNYPEQSGA